MRWTVLVRGGIEAGNLREVVSVQPLSCVSLSLTLMVLFLIFERYKGRR